jgi:Tfp pilus assembly protein PilN
LKPVNLIPSEQRRSARADGGGISVRVGLLLGGLGVAVVLVLVFVLISNQVNTKKDELARTTQKEQAAQTASAALKPYGDFVNVSQERVATVTALEDSRFNWERTVRQLAHVIAPGVWVSSFKGSVAAGSGGASGGGGGVRSSISGPAIELSGCAPSQETVARMMARMRDMDGATEVVTSRSEKGSAGSGGGSASGDSGTGAGGGCPNGYYSFDLTVGLTGESSTPPAAATGPGAATSGAAQTAAAQSGGNTGPTGATGTGATGTTGGTP